MASVEEELEERDDEDEEDDVSVTGVVDDGEHAATRPSESVAETIVMNFFMEDWGVKADQDSTCSLEGRPE